MIDMIFDHCSEESWQFVCRHLVLRQASSIGATEAGLFLIDADHDAPSAKMREIVHVRRGPHTPDQRGAAAAEFLKLIEYSISKDSDAALSIGNHMWCLIVRYKEKALTRAALAAIVIPDDGADARRRLRRLQGARDGKQMLGD